MAPVPLETAKSHRKLETKEMSVTAIELKSLLVKKKVMDGNSEGRVELVLPNNLEKGGQR